MNVRVNFNHRFTDEKGLQIKFGVRPYSRFKDLAVSALLHAASAKGAPEPDAQEKLHRYQLAAKIQRCTQQQGMVELKDEDRDLILRCCGQAFHTLIVGAVGVLLEGKKPEAFPADEEEETQKPALAEAPPAEEEKTAT